VGARSRLRFSPAAYGGERASHASARQGCRARLCFFFAAGAFTGWTRMREIKQLEYVVISVIHPYNVIPDKDAIQEEFVKKRYSNDDKDYASKPLPNTFAKGSEGVNEMILLHTQTMCCQQPHLKTGSGKILRSPFFECVNTCSASCNAALCSSIKSSRLITIPCTTRPASIFWKLSSAQKNVSFGVVIKI
jgi:hypothetical protein